MLRRKYRERRNSAWERKWLQRELEASGLALGVPIKRRNVPPPSTTATFSSFITQETTRPKRHRPRRTREAPLFN